MSQHWTFRHYVTSAGVEPVAKWYGKQADDFQAAFDTVLEYLGQRSRDEWRRPEFDVIHGKKYSGLSEIRFKVRNVQHRIFGYFGPGRSEFTMLVPAIEKGRKYDPPNALDTALKRMKEVLKDGKLSHVWVL